MDRLTVRARLAAQREFRADDTGFTSYLPRTSDLAFRLAWKVVSIRANPSFSESSGNGINIRLADFRSPIAACHNAKSHGGGDESLGESHGGNGSRVVEVRSFKTGREKVVIT